MELALLLIVAVVAGFCLGHAVGFRRAQHVERRVDALIADLHRHNEVL